VKALGDLTMQIAEQALATARTPAPPAQADSLCAVILGQLQAMQKALKEDEELLISCAAGGEIVRVLEFFVPAPRVVVLKGLDAARNIVRVVSPIEALQLVSKVVKVPPGGKPTRTGFIFPKPKPE
jgi:hypothetical protein